MGIEKKGVEEVYVKPIQDMYTDCKTAVRSHARTTASFEVGVGLHQGSALSPLLFIIIIMDVIAENIATTTPRAILFADDLELCEETKGEAEQQLEVWRNAMESRGLRASQQKTEYLAPLTSEWRLTMDNRELPTVSKFKYLGSTVDAEGGVETNFKSRVRPAWNKWRELTGVVCDKKVPLKLKHQLYKTAIKPTLCYVRECWTLKRKDEQPLSTTEMCRLCCYVTDCWTLKRKDEQPLSKTEMCRLRSYVRDCWTLKRKDEQPLSKTDTCRLCCYVRECWTLKRKDEQPLSTT